MAKKLDYSKSNVRYILTQPRRRFYEGKPKYNFASYKQKSWCESILGIQIDRLSSKQAEEIINAYLLSRSGGKRIDQKLYVKILSEEYLERF
jgi:hypothetical protein